MVKEMKSSHCHSHEEPEQFKVFHKILTEHCDIVQVLEGRDQKPLFELSDANGELIAEIDYWGRKVLCQNEEVQEHLVELLDIHLGSMNNSY
jgi:hypothetical protein